MSLQTWEEEFYPESAEEAAERGEAAAVEHSLRKWEGLKAENLDRHEMWAYSMSISEAGTEETAKYLDISSWTCALCHMVGKSCRTCPLYKARDCFGCDRRRHDEGFSPWQKWTDNSDPEPMILWLKKAREHCND